MFSKKKCKTLAYISAVMFTLFILHEKIVPWRSKFIEGATLEDPDGTHYVKRRTKTQEEHRVQTENTRITGGHRQGELPDHNSPQQHQTRPREAELSDTMETQESGEARIQREQDRRKELIKNVCAKRKAANPSVREMYDDTKRHIYVVDKHKLMFCYIPKVGCSNWKRILMILQDNSRSIDDIDSREAHARNKLNVLRMYTGKQLEWRLRTYRKFMFVRHPLSRITSAYKNKYADLDVFRTAPIVLQRYALRIMKKYRADATPRELQTGENITWSEWLQYIADPTEQKSFDRHWKEMYKLCSPCAIDYDYIGKLENTQEEADYIMDKLEISHIVRYPNKENSHPTNTSVNGAQSQFNNATQFQLRRISQIYDLDFQLFGYFKPTILPPLN